MSTPLFTVPGMDAEDAGQVCDLLQQRRRKGERDAAKRAGSRRRAS
jgi:hypothetical protein